MCFLIRHYWERKMPSKIIRNDYVNSTNRWSSIEQVYLRMITKSTAGGQNQAGTISSETRRDLCKSSTMKCFSLQIILSYCDSSTSFLKLDNVFEIWLNFELCYFITLDLASGVTIFASRFKVKKVSAVKVSFCYWFKHYIFKLTVKNAQHLLSAFNCELSLELLYSSFLNNFAVKTHTRRKKDKELNYFGHKCFSSALKYRIVAYV